MASRQMRKFPLGQDRYARQYWVLPSLGGILVEGVETSLDVNFQLDLPKEEEGAFSITEGSSSLTFKEELRQTVAKQQSMEMGTCRDQEGVAMSKVLASENMEVGNVGKNGRESLPVNEDPSASAADGKLLTDISMDVDVSQCRGSECGQEAVGSSGKIQEVDVVGDATTDKPEVNNSENEAQLAAEQATKRTTQTAMGTDTGVRSDIILDSSQDGGIQQCEAPPTEYGGNAHPSSAAGVIVDSQSGKPSAEHMSSVTSMSGTVINNVDVNQASKESTTVQQISQVVAPRSSDGTLPTSVGSRLSQTPPTVDQRLYRADKEEQMSSQDSSVVVQTTPSVTAPTPQGAVSVTTPINQVPDQQQQQQQQQVIVGAPPTATPTQQYVYVTPDGQVVGVVPNQQVAAGGVATGVNPSPTVAVPATIAAVPAETQNVAYALIGYSLVPVLTGGGGGASAIVGGQQQIMAVNPASAQQPQQQQQQYVIAQTDQQGNVQYYALPGSAVGGGASGGVGVWPGQQQQQQQQQQQPQYAIMVDANGQQQLVQVMGQSQGDAGQQQMIVMQSSSQPQVVPGVGGGAGQILVAPGAAGVAGAGQVVLTAATTQQQQGNQVIVAGGGAGQQYIMAAGIGQNQIVMALQQKVAQEHMAAKSAAIAVDPQQQQQATPIGGGAASSSAVSDAMAGYEVIRGRQVVFIPEKSSYGVLSSDGAKLVISNSKEEAIATLQAANSMVIGGGAGGVVVAPTNQTMPAQHSASPVVAGSASHSSSPVRSTPVRGAMPTSSRATPTSALATPTHHTPVIKKEPISPDQEVHRQFTMSSSAGITPQQASGKATPTTIGQVTENMETSDTSRDQGEQKVRKLLLLFYY